MTEPGDAAALVERQVGTLVEEWVRDFRVTIVNGSTAGVVFFTGERPLPFGDRLMALPVSLLWGGAPPHSVGHGSVTMSLLMISDDPPQPDSVAAVDIDATKASIAWVYDTFLNGQNNPDPPPQPSSRLVTA